MPKVSNISIIVPCYNYGWLLAETLDSVLLQTYRSWECIIVDDGSVDNTREIAQHYIQKDNRFRYVYRDNGGLSAARNTGIKESTGRYLQFLDADDLLAPQKLAIQFEMLLKHPEVDIIYGDVRYFLHGDFQNQSRSFDMRDVPWVVPMNGRGLTLLELFVERNRMVVNAPLIRAELVSRVGLFSPELRSMEDWEFWVRCAVADAYFYYDDRPEAWSFVRVHSSSLSQNKAVMLSYIGRVRQQLEKTLNKIGNEKAVALNRSELDALREYSAVYNIQHGNIGTGLKLFWQIARATGRYSYYLRTTLYWLRKRQPQS